MYIQFLEYTYQKFYRAMRKNYEQKESTLNFQKKKKWKFEFRDRVRRNGDFRKIRKHKDNRILRRIFRFRF
ncbi:hypothetical protein A0128_10065 [Leptospira tipperaryensis]|uniref:Uncharacterized protein n=1 Tax=Leptospira tipperaryensis TaxID=2564040 RepID=A0A1D7UX49_9LEPT|nr:hypothetical protein A0128_10065 [Leptospira tipperaryensis]